MIQSMTGFSSKEAQVKPFGKISVELRSTNHKFLEVVFHLPEGFLSLEEKIKKEIEKKIKRGRVICAINISGGQAQGIFINEALLKNYVSILKKIKGRFKIGDQISMDALIQLPGILSLENNRIPKEKIWPELRVLINRALDSLASGRKKEGRALGVFLRSKAAGLKGDLEKIKARFKKAIKNRCLAIQSDEERTAFLKNSDITEEMERLEFHIRNFQDKLGRKGSVGKELDFIAQEMQREANTLAAKSCDTQISGTIVEVKSRIEKIREQAQNVE